MSDALKESRRAEPSPDLDAAIAELRSVAGSAQLLQGEETQAYAIDGVAPRAVVFPHSATEVATVLEHARGRGLNVYPRGGGTQMSMGNVPERVDILLSLERLRRVIAHEPADMTVTVEAGIPLVQLQESLRKSGQFLPIDPPLGSGATVGGILASRAFGPLRFAFRTVADSLLGVTVVSADGRTTKAGGRVVKNVSGYELGRLYTGSMGTLAVIVEATFKVQPLARTRQAFLATCRDAQAAHKAVHRLFECGVQPAFVELVGPVSSDAEANDSQEALSDLLKQLEPYDGPVSSVLAVGFMGTPEDVAWQLETAERTLKTTHNGQTAPKTAQAPWESVYDHVQAIHKGAESAESITCRVHLPDTELYGFLDHVTGVTAEFGSIHIAAHAGSGIARIHFTPKSLASGRVDEIVDTIAALRERAKAARGRLIIERAPTLVKARIDVWGEPGDDFFLHQAVKERMDPTRVLSPGRFVGGI